MVCGTSGCGFDSHQLPFNSFYNNINLENHILGFSRIGHNRDIKSILEKCFYSNNELNFLNLEEIKRKILYKNWKLIIKNNINYINLGDFSYYDHILDNIFNLNFFPKKFNNKFLLKNYFECVKGNKNNHPMEMIKWFNTNYHYIFPEYYIDTEFKFNDFLFKKDLFFSKIFNKKIKFILIGPFTLLKLGKIKDNFLKNRLLFLPKILNCYINFLNYLNKNKINLIQIDEPIIVLNIYKIWFDNLKNFYNLLCSYFSNIIFSTYFEELKIDFLKKLENINFKFLHLQLSNNKKYNEFLNNISNKISISIGLIDGKNIWINDFEKSWYEIKKFSNSKNIILSTTCSLIHLPIDKNMEKSDNFNFIKNWISFGIQKLNEIKILSDIYNSFNKKFKKFFLSKNFIKNIFFIRNKKKSKLVFLKKIQKKIINLNIEEFKYRKNYWDRIKIQKNYFNFQYLTSTTIGSFPQTKKIRKLRLDYKNNLISKLNYENFIKREINYIIKKQIDYKIDVIVHGEPERNDIVEYFSENFKGFFMTNKGWVQSCGSRYVKPPIIYGNIYLKKYISLNWLKYSQKLSKKPVKDTLTGPITISKWSFRRNDQPNYITCIQLSLSINKEILKLEKIGIKIIQVDEPAISEFLSIKKTNYKNYLNWSTKSFLLIYKNLKLNTQIHTHICYSNFKNILTFLKKINIDVITVETSRSNFKIISNVNRIMNFKIGLGIYDIHTNKIMDVNNSIYILKLIINNINIDRMWINLDCGLKTRKWEEIDKSLSNLTNSINFLKNKIF